MNTAIKNDFPCISVFFRVLQTRKGISHKGTKITKIYGNYLRQGLKAQWP